ncbi:LysM peptidoglycan-binding domain-containing protein [Aspergillus saccharolyticus JOP 1030-1]|uniref:LysM domain-containing protein n=1 Tax=Aspergillus saccharolyticus JOP 1030-1 TaxID=1450539 RepID=A0A318ZM68_9EURO|nr:hypothetical protein BP01DRAFT_363219 [Aspergillus saccharolyticus JOP 1030-1]PYH48037.1 hypothetical protein BP01DRAFT_363219 [Aspergillus saccharolyticus JOP 1030-1]
MGNRYNATLTTLLCASSCEASLAQLHDSVSASCGSSAELIPGMSFLALVDQVWSSWNHSCFADPTTGENCNDEIATFDNVDSLSNISTSDLCSYCYVKKLELMQADAYSDVYNDDWQTTFEYVAATCNLTVADFNATASAFNASVPTTTSTCVSQNVYTTKNGDTCDSIALAEGISAATMYYTNPNILNCSDIAAGTTLCLPLTCTDVYSVQSNDTCSSVAVANFITTAEVINWNSQLNWNCSNLHSTNPYWGSVLCVSPPGGTYTGQALNTTSSGEEEPVDPPAGVQVALGTTLDCGAWFVNEASLNYNCSDICLANSIAIHLFTEANPSLNYTTCDSDLVTGDAYCVDPLSGWQYSNMTATNSSSTTVTAATSPTAPVQTGIAANCNAYYAAKTGDSCDSIAAEFDITVAQFLAWNPAISSNCTSGFWADEDYCVGVVTNTTATVTASSTTLASPSSSSSSSVSSTSSVTPPAPTQSGIPANCDAYAVAETGDNCATIAAKYNITRAQFLAWNPAISSDCTTGFWADEAYCVGVSSSSTTTATTTTAPTISAASTSAASVTPPAPTQSGIPSDCDEYYVVQLVLREDSAEIGLS